MALPWNIRGSASQLFFQDQDSPVYKSLLAISHLPHPDRSVLVSLINDAHDKESAARFFLRAISVDQLSDSSSTRGEISEFLYNWKSLIHKFRPQLANNISQKSQNLIYGRDGACCHVSPKFEGPAKQAADAKLNCVHIVSPTILLDPELAEGQPLRAILSAFLGTDLMESLLSFSISTNSGLTDRLDNIWLVSGRTFDAIEHGEIRFKIQPWALHPETSLMQTYNIEVNNFMPHSSHKRLPPPVSSVRIENRTPDVTPSLSENFLNIHYRFSPAIAWVETGVYMKVNVKSLSTTRAWRLPHSTAKSMFRVFRFLWSALHTKVRSHVYDGLIWVGLRLYGRTISDITFKAPFGLYLRRESKASARSHKAEKAALDMVEDLTTIPAPRAIDSLVTAQHSYLVMTATRGQMIGPLLYVMTDEELEQIVLDLEGYVSQLRQISHPSTHKFQICDSLGEGIHDSRIADSQREELRFRTEKDFNQYLKRLVVDDIWQQAAKSHDVHHQIVFTHGDLNPRNILVENGRISGIIDWENAGWFPEYWEYTKAHYSIRGAIRWLADVIDTTFRGYRDELFVENMLSDLSNPF